MAWQIVKQPNGRYAKWNTVVDDFSGFNYTRDEIIEEFVVGNIGRRDKDDPTFKAEWGRIAELVDAVDNSTIAQVRKNWHTWDECIEWLNGDYNLPPGEGKKLARQAIEYGTMEEDDPRMNLPPEE